MVVAKVDSAILRSDEMWELWEQYEKKFGKKFICFNYCDFQRDGDRCAAQVYMDTIKQCLHEGKPCAIVSKWCQPGSLIDH